MPNDTTKTVTTTMTLRKMKRLIDHLEQYGNEIDFDAPLRMGGADSPASLDRPVRVWQDDEVVLYLQQNRP